MPSRKTHRKISLLFLGEEHENVDRFLDLPAAFMGPAHRKILHSLPEAIVAGLILGGPKGAAAAVLHVTTDVVSSSVKKEVNEAVRKRKARVGTKRRKKRRCRA